jgi:hypothetical protein
MKAIMRFGESLSEVFGVVSATSGNGEKTVVYEQKKSSGMWLFDLLRAIVSRPGAWVQWCLELTLKLWGIDDIIWGRCVRCSRSNLVCVVCRRWAKDCKAEELCEGKQGVTAD